MSSSMKRRKFLGLAGASLAAAPLVDSGYGLSTGRLRGGVSKVDITPRVGCWLSGWERRVKSSEGIADELYVKALVLSDGTTELAIIAADLIGVPAEIVSAVRGKAQQQTGIPGENILVSATHTHFGPVVRRYKFDSKVDEAYLEFLVEKMVSAVVGAKKGLTEVRVGITRGQAPELVYNRRTKGKDGKVVMTFVLPPKDPELAFGPVDPDVGVLRMEDSEGKLIATMINFACHPVSGGGWESWFYHISADYPAYAAKAIEQTEGGLCLFTLGTAGNINPVRRGRRARFQTGYALGGEVLKQLQLLSVTEAAALGAVSKKIRLPLKKKVPDNVIYKPPSGKTEIITEIQALRICDFLFLGLPGEVLVEIGFAIKERLGDKKILFLTQSNDTIGYICHSEAYDEGGYEPIRGSVLAQGAGEILVREAVKLVKQLKERG